MQAAAQLIQSDRYADLSTLFSSSARAAVLRAFMLDPTRAYYQRQLEAATGLPIRAIQRELKRLTDVGLLYRRSEGNRAYYQVDMDFRLFPELRSMILKAVDRRDVLRGMLALDPAVRCAFLHPTGERALLVASPGMRPGVAPPTGILFDMMTSDEFLQAVAEGDTALATYLNQGVDLLGRREDVIWRHIEAAGYTVEKGDGVP